MNNSRYSVFFFIKKYYASEVIAIAWYSARIIFPNIFNDMFQEWSEVNNIITEQS